MPPGGNTAGAVDNERADESAAALLAAVVQDSDDAILTKDLDGIITSWNRGAERLYGYTAKEIVGRPVTTLIPADRLDEEPSILARLRAGERIEHYETVRQRKDGSFVDISLTVSPLRNKSGQIIGASKIARDISERKRAAEQQQLMMGELQHRTRNLVAVIEGIARQTRPRDVPQVNDYVDALMARLRALFGGTELIFASARRRADVLDVARTALGPFITGPGDAITLSGSEVHVSEHTAASLALAFHELATNALKYGALKDGKGKVALTVDVQPSGDDARVTIEWKETGCELTGFTPSRKGFGNRVIEAAAGGERDRSVTQEFEPDGLRCRFCFTAKSSDIANG